MRDRRCDALCHQAKRKKCDCWCGGKYHGMGAEAAARFEDDFGLSIDAPDFCASISEDADPRFLDASDINISPDYRKLL